MNTFLFEDHDEAYFIWKRLGIQSETLVHIDAHLDFDWIYKQSPEALLNVGNLGAFRKSLQGETPFNLNVEEAQKQWIHIGNYIYPAMQEGLVKTFYWVLPDPIWNGPERKLVKGDLVHNFKKYHRGTWRTENEKEILRFTWDDKAMIVLGLKQLPIIKTPVLLDIDVDFLVTQTLFALASKNQITRRFPWIWPSELIRNIQQKLISKVTTIAYSVEGGYTPISFKFFGDELKEILTGVYPPENPFYLLRKQGIQAQQKGDWKLSLEFLLKAQKIRPKDASIAWALAESHWELKEKADASKQHQLAVLLDSTYRTEFNSHGIRLEMIKERRLALKEFEKVMERDPTDPKAKCSAGWQHVHYKRLDKALGLFQEASFLDPSLADAQLGLGYIWMKQKKWEEAQKAFKKAIQYKTQNKSVYYWIGKVLEKQGEFQESIQQYNQFIRSGRHNIWVSLKLFRLYWRQGATLKAKWEIERVLRVFKRLLSRQWDILDWNWRKLVWRMST